MRVSPKVQARLCGVKKKRRRASRDRKKYLKDRFALKRFEIGVRKTPLKCPWQRVLRQLALRKLAITACRAVSEVSGQSSPSHGDEAMDIDENSRSETTRTVALFGTSAGGSAIPATSRLVPKQITRFATERPESISGHRPCFLYQMLATPKQQIDSAGPVLWSPKEKLTR